MKTLVTLLTLAAINLAVGNPKTAAFVAAVGAAVALAEVALSVYRDAKGLPPDAE